MSRSSQERHPPLLWGVGNSDHQVEAFEEDARDIRDVWEEQDGQTPRGRATDFRNRYPEDVALAAALGCRMFRVSTSWARVEPTPGQWERAALDHYRDVVTAIRGAGMEPMVTLHHFTWPIHVEERGGTIAPEFPEWFRAYAAVMADALGEQVRYWVTFNEPTLLPFGYVKPWWTARYSMPPGRPGVSEDVQLRDAAALIRNLFLAHTVARAEIRDRRSSALVGVNPFLLGLPGWLQRLMDWATVRPHSLSEWCRQGQRLTSRAPLGLGGADVALAMVTETPERDRRVLFSDSYYLAKSAVLVAEGSTVTGAADLRGKTVVVVSASSSAELVHSLLPDALPKPVAGHDVALRQLQSGGADAFLSDEPILAGIIARSSGLYRMLLVGNRSQRYAAAVAGGNQDVLAHVNHTIQTVRLAEGHPASPPSAGLGKDAPSMEGPAVRAIRKRGYLRVIVRDDVPGFGHRAGGTGELVGLEIDLARAVARQILGDPGKVEFLVVPSQRRLPALRTLWRQIIEPIQRVLALFGTLPNMNWWHLGMAGRLPEFLCPPECVGQQDYVGLDYYWGISNISIHWVLRLIDSTQQKFSRAPVWPGGLFQILRAHAAAFPDLPILIVENGCVENADGISRSEYLRRHTRELLRARQAGCKVVAYVCWSITTNREWGLPLGADSDFGLYFIDLDGDSDLRRVETDSARAYRALILEADRAEGAKPQ